MRVRTLRAAAVVVVLLFSAAAQAAKLATVDIENTEVHEGPGKGYKLVEKLTRGSFVTASNLPVEGWFKVRTQSGAVGWVPADSLVLGSEVSAPPPSSSGSSSAPPAAAPAPTPATQTFEYAKPKEPRKWVAIRGLFGAEFLNMSALEGLVAPPTTTTPGGVGLSTQFTAGGEFGVWVLPWLGAMLRAEYLFQSAQASNNTTGKIYSFTSSALPLMGGIDFRLFDTKWIAGRASVYGGFALWTDLKVYDMNVGATPFTELTGPAFPLMGKVDFDIKVSTYFYVFVEGGYRYLASRPLTPSNTTASAADGLFKSSGVFQAVALDFNGPFVSAGVTLTF